MIPLMRMSEMSGKEMRFQVPPKAYRLDGRITQRIRQWVPNRRTEKARVKYILRWNQMKPWNIQFAKAGRTEVAAGNFGDWHAAVGEVLRSSVPKTPMNNHGKFVLQRLWIRQPLQIITQRPWKTTLVYLGSCDQTRCSVLLPLQLIIREQNVIQGGLIWAPGDGANWVTHIIFNHNLYYSNASFTLKFNEKKCNLTDLNDVFFKFELKITR